MAFFWPKNQTFEIKNYRGVTEEWCKIRRKTELRFGKWHEEFGNFSPGHSKVSNLGLWWDPFFQSRKCMSLKFTEELCVLTMKKDIKFEEELTSPFQNWQILIRPLESLKNCTLMGSFLPKYIMLELKGTEELCLVALKIDWKFEGNWLVLSEWTWGIWQSFTGWKIAILF